MINNKKNILKEPGKFFRIVRALLLILLSCYNLNSFAQQTTKVTTKQIPPFQITQSDGSVYRSSQLAKAPVVIIYFSPDCHHCVDFSRHLFNNYDRINNKQIVMITYQDLSMLKGFDSQFNLKHYATIKTGTEGRSLAVQRYYGVMQFPFVALHNSAGQLVRTFEGEQPFPEIIKAIQQLK